MGDAITNEKSRWILIMVFALALILDQGLKVWVKLNFQLGEEVMLLGLPWARLRFVENEGMAFGFLLGGEWGKILLTCIRIFAVVFIFYTLRYFQKRGAPFTLLLFLTLILGGALGNAIDSTFYGQIFSASPFHGGRAEWWPVDGGYAPLFQGRVVDMLYFPLLNSHWPDWIPVLGGRELKFFEPVFNVADFCVVSGVAGVIYRIARGKI